MELEDFFKQQLEQRDIRGYKRALKVSSCTVDFYSNDYLSLAKFGNNFLTDSATHSTGSSRLIAGNTIAHVELEAQLASYFNSSAALLFNSGYTANLGVLSSIPQKDDIILFDERSHASIKEGVRLSMAKPIKFKHNDLIDLERLLLKHKEQRCFVVTEGLFSMDGVYGKVKEISDLCAKHSAYLIVDEAHSGGTIGSKGQGICAKENIEPFLRIFTLGKAFSSHGAAVLCSAITKQYLVNYARSFIYTTALPAFVIQRSQFIFDKAPIDKQIEKLTANISCFRSIAEGHGLSSDHSSPIQIVKADKSVLQKIEQICESEQIGVKAVYPPTVPKGEDCLRIILHADHQREEIDRLLSILNQVQS